MLFEFKDIMRASRYQCYHQISDTGCAQYLAFYEFGSKEAEAAFQRSPAIKTAGKDWAEKLSGFGIKLKWSAAYESIKTLERD
jgi:hypothetical protein